MKTETKNNHAPEQVGRTYTQTKWEVHSRHLNNPDAKWYAGFSKCNSIDEAKQELAKLGGRVHHIGSGLYMEIKGPRATYEYRIVKRESSCTVEHIEVREL